MRTGHLRQGPRVGLGNQWSLPGADYPRLEGDDVKLIYSNRLTENVSMTVPGYRYLAR